MQRCFSAPLLRRLRNEINFAQIFADLRWPHKRRNNQLLVRGVVEQRLAYVEVFVCPLCRETQSAVNPRTNLARCFHCETNFNPIDFTMAVQHCSFVEAVHYLEPWLVD